MAELVQVGDGVYKKREPLGVLGLSFISLGIYFLSGTTRSTSS
jgi:hypothetical protein